MPSDETGDERIALALDVLAKAREEYRSALVATEEELRGLLEMAGGATDEERTARTAAELGKFAAGRIDVGRFAAFDNTAPQIAEGASDRLEAAARTLRSLIEEGDALHVVRLPAGAELRQGITDALAHAGRAFGAARTAELARAGRYDETLHGGWLEAFPPHLWNARERSVAPPIVVELEGSDLRPSGLADYLDGAQQIVLLARGMTPPAALADLITPGLTVLQVDEAEGLAPMAGPAIGAVVAPDACLFVHVADPAGERGRLTVHHMPETEPKRALGGISAFRLAQGMRQLAALSATLIPAAPEPGDPAGDGATAPVPTESATDKLAAWILRQADLSGLD
jgi:hypothetical protein